MDIHPVTDFGKVEAEYHIGIDLGGTNIIAGIVDTSNRILAKAGTPTLAGRPASDIMADMAAMSLEAAARADIPFENVKSIGIGAPGTANKQSGIMEVAVNLFWEMVPLRDAVSQLLKRPVYIENDANAAAYGEYIAGVARGYDSSLTITLGTGIGGGMVLHGQILEGFNYGGMEVGHMVIVKDGRQCACGRRGCFERYASASGLILTTLEHMEQHPGSRMWTLTEGDRSKVSGWTAFDAMRDGDNAAALAVAAYISDLACGITNLINILQPDILAIGGGISKEGDTLLDPLRENICREAFSRNSTRNSRIVAAKLGNDAGIIGAANLYREIKKASPPSSL